ncbi:hypothetical protein, partial [Kordia periserrulae]|uniref:hypothetical protein n=1 Tax=Kordia periserrulae TaxID=701523 RepID=UPI001B881084
LIFAGCKHTTFFNSLKNFYLIFFKVFFCLGTYRLIDDVCITLPVLAAANIKPFFIIPNLFLPFFMPFL